MIDIYHSLLCFLLKSFSTTSKYLSWFEKGPLEVCSCNFHPLWHSCRGEVSTVNDESENNMMETTLTRMITGKK